MSIKKHVLHIILIISFFLSSCVKVDFATPEDNQLIITWKNRTSGVDIPSSYTVEIGGQILQMQGEINNLPKLNTGNNWLIAYNTADKITLSDNIETASTTNGFVDSQIGWLFTNAQTVAIVKACEQQQISMDMIQQVRQLNIILTLIDSDLSTIESLSGQLDGVSNQLNIDNGVVTGSTVKVAFEFDSKDNKLSSSIRLLGVNTSVNQILSLNITYTDGSTQVITQDVTSLLTGFNKDKYIPMTLTNTIRLSNEAGFTATIKDWEIIVEDIIINR